MADGKTKQSTGVSIVQRIVVAAVVVLVLGGVGYAYAQRNVYRVSIRPGEATTIMVEVPMQRFGRAKSFAKELARPGKRTRSIEFTIDGEGDWPEATIVVKVRK